MPSRYAQCIFVIVGVRTENLGEEDFDVYHILEVALLLNKHRQRLCANLPIANAHMEPYVHFAVNVIGGIQEAKAHRGRHEPRPSVNTRTRHVGVPTHFNINGWPISPRWSSVGCISTTDWRTSVDSHASSRNRTATSRTSNAGSYSCVRRSRSVHAFVVALARMSEPR